MARWRCTFTDVSGKRCENEALHRLHFSNDRPFDFVDACAEHFEEYKLFCWVQPLQNQNGEEVFQ